MNVFLIILAVLTAALAALEFRRRSRRRQRTRGGGLALDRQGGRSQRPGARGGSGSSLASPLLLGLVLLVLTGWLAAAYLLPGRSTTAEGTPPADAPPAEQIPTLAGRLDQPAVPPLPPDSAPVEAPGRAAEAPSRLAALELFKSVGQSGLEQVGLLAGTGGRSAGRSAASPPPAPSPPPAQTRPARTPESRQPQTRPAPATAPEPERPAAPAPEPDRRPSLVSAASGSPPAPAAPAAGTSSGGREYTVHLASFTERDNAEKYKTRLASAGEMAFITETTVEGRLWFRVMSGRFGSRAAAESHGRNLRRRNLTADSGSYLIKTVD